MNPMRLRACPISLVVLLLVGRAAAETFAIRDVTVINPRTASVRAHWTVIVDGDRIRSAGPTAAIPENAHVVDGRGKFLIPGLWDAHVHLTKAGTLSLPLFVVNGITGVRDMGSDLTDIARWRKQIESGTHIGPHIKTSGPILESRTAIDDMKRGRTVEPVDKLRVGILTAEEGRAAVRRLAKLGVDHLKMRSAPSTEAFRAVADEAKRQRLPFAAHPVGAPEELLRAGLRSVEHAVAFPSLAFMSEPERRQLFRQMAAKGMFLSNTMVNFDALLSVPYEQGTKIIDDSAGQVDSRRKYLCGYLLKDWREQLEETKDALYDPLRKQLPDLYGDFREMREEKVPFLAGTDVGVLFMYPGFSLHDELEKLVKDVGFSPMEVLAIATSGVPDFYQISDRFGAIEAGRNADLVLLDADPVADIRNTRRIAAVITQGHLLERAKLQSILDRVEQAANSSCSAQIGWN
jgi:imidazolonepropionase-like amidohydrolase